MKLFREKKQGYLWTGVLLAAYHASLVSTSSSHSLPGSTMMKTGGMCCLQRCYFVIEKWSEIHAVLWKVRYVLDLCPQNVRLNYGSTTRDPLHCYHTTKTCRWSVDSEEDILDLHNIGKVNFASNGHSSICFNLSPSILSHPIHIQRRITRFMNARFDHVERPSDNPWSL